MAFQQSRMDKDPNMFNQQSYANEAVGGGLGIGQIIAGLALAPVTGGASLSMVPTGIASAVGSGTSAISKATGNPDIAAVGNFTKQGIGLAQSVGAFNPVAAVPEMNPNMDSGVGNYYDSNATPSSYKYNNPSAGSGSQ